MSIFNIFDGLENLPMIIIHFCHVGFHVRFSSIANLLEQ